MNDQGEEQSQESRDPTPRSREITLRPDYTTAFPGYYANFAVITHTTYDISIDFCFVAPPHNLDVSQGILALPVVTRVTIPGGLVQGLINALNIELTAQRQEQEQQGRLSLSGPLREGGSDG